MTIDSSKSHTYLYTRFPALAILARAVANIPNSIKAVPEAPVPPVNETVGAEVYPDPVFDILTPTITQLDTIVVAAAGIEGLPPVNVTALPLVYPVPPLLINTSYTYRVKTGVPNVPAFTPIPNPSRSVGALINDIVGGREYLVPAVFIVMLVIGPPLIDVAVAAVVKVTTLKVIVGLLYTQNQN